MAKGAFPARAAGKRDMDYRGHGRRAEGRRRRAETWEMEVYSDPRAEWDQMYRERGGFSGDFFYDPSLHGLNLAGTEKKYRAYLTGVGGRADLNYLFTEMLGI